MEQLYNIDKHFTDLSSGIKLRKYYKEISSLRKGCNSKYYFLKILVENLSKHTNSFNKVNQEKNNSKCRKDSNKRPTSSIHHSRISVQGKT